ncbi:MAG: hypothetical protein QG644_409 [Patescibacteria group bacterium]|nr:hypothetical protein [Patescibacteria group bacterium]
MEERIFIFPADPDTNESIAKDPSMVQVEPIWNDKCYIGKNEVELPLYPVENIIFKKFKKTKMVFYAFIQKGKDGRKQFFHSQGINPKSVLSQSALSQKIAELIKNSKAEKEEA